MTYDELMTKINVIIPGAQFDFDIDGQIVINTGLRYNEATRTVVVFDPLAED